MKERRLQLTAWPAPHRHDVCMSPLPFNAEFAVAGISLADRQAIAAQLTPNDAVNFVCVDDNPHDANAVEVRCAHGVVGFVPASLAGRVRSHGGTSYDGKIVRKLGGGAVNIGLRVCLTAVSGGETSGSASPVTARHVMSPTGRLIGSFVSSNDDFVRVRLPGTAATVLLPTDNVTVRDVETNA